MKYKKYLQFNYQLHHGKAPFKAWIRLNYYKYVLRAKRILRFCKRCSLYVYKYIPILLCVILFEILIIPVGLKLNKYDSWIDGIWDLRVFMLTSLIISIFTGILNSEIDRNRTLKKQYETYQILKCNSENFICTLCSIAGILVDDAIFMSEELFDEFYKMIYYYQQLDSPRIRNPIIEDSKLLYSTKNLKRSVMLVIVIKQYLRELNRVNNALVSYNFEGSKAHCIDQIDYIYNELLAELLVIEEQEDDYSDFQLLKFIDSISRCILPAIADIRRPWRWDMVLNYKISKILKESNNCGCVL